MKKASVLTALVLVIFTFSSFKNAQEETKESEKPKNVILLIGDGMGLSQLSSAYYFGDTEPNFSRFPVVGLSRTSSAKEKITDSAAGATALSCGQKTYNGAIAVDVKGNDMETILEYLSGKEYSTAVLATSSITHATPASFYAHAKSRHQANHIASQMPESGVDFFAGGGKDYFLNKEKNPDLIGNLKRDGFIINTEELISTEDLNKDKKYGFILADDGMPKMSKGRGTFLKDATGLALDYLKLQEAPFFMMVEGSQIDWGGHANDAKYVIKETLDFDEVLGLVLDFAEKDGNTLVVVTADHETGGFTLSAKEKKVPFQGRKRDYKSIDPTFSTGGHSATMVPVLAYGPGAENFTGIYQNTQIYWKIKEIVDGSN